MSEATARQDLAMRQARPTPGDGLIYGWRTARAWWYSAWLRSLARFSRTYLGSFWLGLSNLLSVALLGLVYGAVLGVQDPLTYVVFLGLGLTIWVLISQSVTSGASLFSQRRDQLVNNSMPAIFYCLEEWAFQLQTFAQAFGIILIALSFIQKTLLLHALTSIWLPLLNLILFSFWMIVVMAVLGSRFKDLSQLLPILLQLLFLVSPILYPSKNLGEFTFLADFNPFYRILEPLRTALIEGLVAWKENLAILGLNLLLIGFGLSLLKRFRYRFPIWA
jgi:lipopolysaccharide transport system permease protein